MIINKILRKINSYISYYFKLYKYDSKKYPDSFVSKQPKIKNVKLENAPKIIYTFWTGNNPITPNRQKGLESLRKKTQVKVKLITPENLQAYILKDYPLHPAYEYLSLIHRSDYLRAYFMLHLGGGYADIKKYSHLWKKAFEELNSRDDKWAIGYRELGAWGVPKIPGKLGQDLKKNYLYLIGNGAFIYKPQSPIAKEWMQEVHNRLDFFFEALKKNPAKDIFGSNPEYPIPWAHLMGEIHHPLLLKYHERILHDKSLLPSMKNYR